MPDVSQASLSLSVSLVLRSSPSTLRIPLYVRARGHNEFTLRQHGRGVLAARS